MIIDCHCHAGKGEGFTGPWDTNAPLDDYLVRATRAGIQKTVLFSAFHSDYAVANRAVARIVASRPHQFYGFAFVHADRDRGRVHELVRVAVERYQFVGIKVHRYDARLSREICEAARAWGLPVLYDPMGEVAIAELLGVEYPDVNFIFPHLGSFSDDWRAQMALIDPLTRFSNLYADTSGVRRFDVLQDAVRRAGAHKVLFGSDGPWLHPGVEMTKVLALDLTPEQQGWILGGNLLRLFSTRKLQPNPAPPVTISRERGPTEFRDPWAGEMPA
jgi:predicted TIM-barrel fold metal-dependent hydrolase